MVKSPSLTTLLPNYTMYFIIFVDAESIELLWHYPGRFNPRLQYYYKKMVSLFLIPVTGVKSICCWLICASINQSHINFIIIWFIFSILFIGSEPTTWPANNCLQIMVFSCAYGSNDDLAINNILLMQSCVHEKQTYWSNDKTIIIELGFHNISWFFSVSQINSLPQPSASTNNWPAHHWQIRIFCSTLSNN